MKETRKTARARETERERVETPSSSSSSSSVRAGFASAQDNSEHERVRCRLFPLPFFGAFQGGFASFRCGIHTGLETRVVGAGLCAARFGEDVGAFLVRAVRETRERACPISRSPPRYTDEEAVSAATVFAKEARAG